MSLDFTIPELQLNGAGTPPFAIFKQGFALGGTSGGTQWQDIILSGNTALTLANAKANGLEYLKLFGMCEQTGTPTPTTPVNIVCNNGALKWDSVNSKIYVDGTTETVQVHGKNLLDQSTRTDGYYIDVSGNPVQSASYCYSSIIPVVAGEKYTVSLTCGAGQTKRVHAYKDGVWQSQIGGYYVSNGGTLNQAFTIPSGCNGLRLSYANADTNVQVEVGENATAYEPYYSGGTATATDLLAVGTDKDIQEVLTGGITRNIGIKVLDGTEYYGTSSAYGSAVYITSAAAVWGANKSKAILCTHFLGLNSVSGGAQAANTCFFNLSGHIYFRTSMSKEDFQTWVTDQYNAGTPVIIVFVNSTATTSSVTAQSLDIQAGTNIIEITQASIDGLKLEAKYKGISEE